METVCFTGFAIQRNSLGFQSFSCLVGSLKLFNPAMQFARSHHRDSLLDCATITFVFLILVVVNLGIPSIPFFDEVHYLPAARELLDRGYYVNREHPLFGKQMIALGIAIFGDNPIGWRFFSAVAGVLTLFASMRTMWFATLSRFASLAFGIFLATGFMLFVHSSIAMLDIFMVSALSLAAWQFAAAIREPETGRWRLAITGIALGLAMASKWNAIPLAMLPGIVFLLARFSAGRRRLILSERGIPVPGVSLLEAALWLGALPLFVYALTFAPAYEFRDSPLANGGLIGFHREILELQTQVLKPHPYQSSWADWVLNARSIWYYYGDIDGAQRGVLLIGNPFTMIVGIPALIWCLITGVSERNWARIGAVAGYAASLGLWLVAAKSVQFFYHYFVPQIFLLAALALALDTIRQTSVKWVAYASLGVSCAFFVYFFPILSALPLEGPESFRNWTWFSGWV